MYTYVPHPQSPYPIDPGYLEAQVVMSTVLLSLSVVCLLLSIASLLPVKALMAQRSTKVMFVFFGIPGVPVA